MKILVADDDRVLARIIAEALRSANFTPEVVYTAAEASYRLQNKTYAIAILDWNFTGEQLTGPDLIAQIHTTGRDLPTLLLTGRSSLLDRVTGLNHGADDYLAKPFHIPELLSRVKALLRRVRLGKVHTGHLTAGQLELDTNKMCVQLYGQALKLNRKEFQLLRYLLEKPGDTIPRDEIFENIWNSIYPLSNTIEVHIRRLRTKLGEYGKYIRTTRKVGYRFQI